MITITLGENTLPTIQYEKEGIKRSFCVDHNTFFQFIQNNCFETKTVKKKLDLPIFETPTLPEHTIKYMAFPDGKVALFMEQREGLYDITYSGTPFKQVAFPHLLFFFTFHPQQKSYRLAEKRLFAVKNQVIRDNTPLYRFPFSHVGADGSMCYYGSGYSQLQDLSQMTTFIFNWFQTEFSTHYYSESVDKGNNRTGKSLREVFQMLSEQKSFDYNILQPLNFTFEEFIMRQVRQYFPDQDPEEEKVNGEFQEEGSGI